MCQNNRHKTIKHASITTTTCYMHAKLNQSSLIYRYNLTAYTEGSLSLLLYVSNNCSCNAASH